MWLITLLNSPQLSFSSQKYTYCLAVRGDQFHQFVQRLRLIKITKDFFFPFSIKNKQKPAKNILQLDIQIYKCTFNKYTIWIYLEMWYGCHVGLSVCLWPFKIRACCSRLSYVSEVKCCRWDTVGWGRCTLWKHERNRFSLKNFKWWGGTTSLLKWPVTN